MSILEQMQTNQLNQIRDYLTQFNRGNTIDESINQIDELIQIDKKRLEEEIPIKLAAHTEQYNGKYFIYQTNDFTAYIHITKAVAFMTWGEPDAYVWGEELNRYKDGFSSKVLNGDETSSKKTTSQYYHEHLTEISADVFNQRKEMFTLLNVMFKLKD